MPYSSPHAKCSLSLLALLCFAACADQPPPHSLAPMLEAQLAEPDAPVKPPVITGCDERPCGRPAERAEAALASWALPVETCCVTRRSCGLRADPTATTPRPAAATIIASLQELGCRPTREFTLMASTYEELATTALKGTPLTVRDGGVPLPDGGFIKLTDTCPTLHGDTGLFAFTYPGCCLPTGQCGNSNHTLPGLARAGEQLRCLSFDELDTSRSEFIPVPETPTACTY